MDWLKDWGWALALVMLPIALAVAWRLMEMGRKGDKRHQFRNELTFLGILAAGLLVVGISLPDIELEQKAKAIGLVLSLVVALSSQTFLGNAMAGLMIRAVGSVRPGHYIRVQSYFGQVTERRLMHTEIQTEDRDLMTIPNLFLVTHPVKVVRSSGTLLTATVSLGYDVSHAKVQAVLEKATEECGLESPFVHIIALGDFAVTYRIAGLLKEPDELLSSRSRLHVHILDALHRAKIEIVSPNVMATRPLPEGHKILPRPTPSQEIAAQRPGNEPAIEDIAFDKGKEVTLLENQRAELAKLSALVEELKLEARKAETDAERERLEERIQAREWQCQLLESTIQELTARIKDAQ